MLENYCRHTLLYRNKLEEGSSEKDHAVPFKTKWKSYVFKFVLFLFCFALFLALKFSEKVADVSISRTTYWGQEHPHDFNQSKQECLQYSFTRSCSIVFFHIYWGGGGGGLFPFSVSFPNKSAMWKFKFLHSSWLTASYSHSLTKTERVYHSGRAPTPLCHTVALSLSLSLSLFLSLILSCSLSHSLLLSLSYSCSLSLSLLLLLSLSLSLFLSHSLTLALSLSYSFSLSLILSCSLSLSLSLSSSCSLFLSLSHSSV